LKDKRNQGKDQEQMNQKARDMVHDKASDPGEKQQQGDGEPNETAHKSLR
jgi:hypothetical protein